MKSERWARLKDLLDQALELPQDQRDAFVDRECKGDAELKQQLVELLAASEDLDDFISPPKDHVIPVDKIFSSANEEGLLGSIGGFRLIQELGRGGRGVVYLAKPEDSDRLVALKVLSLTALPSAVSVERFQREARSVEKLRHPAIVKIQSLQQDLGRPFLVMDYIDGPSLAAEIAKLQPGAEVDQPSVLRAKDEEPSFLAAKLIEELARAAHHAHERGVIHRDIKPQNVLLDHEGQPYLVDFGLARDDEEVTLTRPGEVEGTPNYMSPEQVHAERNKVDQRTDVYSLGVVLYELLTLKRPFEAPTANQVMANITSRAPMRVRKINESVPRDLELVCMKAMEKNPRHRYQTAAELADDLGRFLRHEGVHATALNPAQMLARHIARRPMPWGLSAAAIVLVSVAAMVNSWMAKAQAFSAVETQLDALTLVDGSYDPMPNFGAVLSTLEGAQSLYGETPQGLRTKLENALQWREKALDYLEATYLDFDLAEVSIGNWRYQPSAEGEPTLAASYHAFSAGLTALGFPSEPKLPFYERRRPKLIVELREAALGPDCRVYLAHFLPREDRFSQFEDKGLVSDLSEGISLMEDTPYRVFLRAKDGRISEGTVLPMPTRSRLVLKFGLRNPDDHSGMVSIASGSYDWLEAQGEGEKEDRIDVGDFWLDEIPVTCGQYWDYLAAAGREQSGLWPADEGLQQALRDRPAVFLTPYEMAAYAAWHGKRLVTMPEYKLAIRGQDGGIYPPGIVPEKGHESMPFDKPTLEETRGTEPEGVSPEWYWLSLILPSVNNIPDYDRAASGVKMIWANIGQVTESVDYKSFGDGTYTPMLWVSRPMIEWSAEEAIEDGLKGRATFMFQAFNPVVGFRCAISNNSIP